MWRRYGCVGWLVPSDCYSGRQSDVLLMVRSHDMCRNTRTVCASDAARCQQDTAPYTPSLVPNTGRLFDSSHPGAWSRLWWDRQLERGPTHYARGVSRGWGLECAIRRCIRPFVSDVTPSFVSPVGPPLNPLPAGGRIGEVSKC